MGQQTAVVIRTIDFSLKIYCWQNLSLSFRFFIPSYLDQGRFILLSFGPVRLFIMWSTRNEHSSFILRAEDFLFLDEGSRLVQDVIQSVSSIKTRHGSVLREERYLKWKTQRFLIHESLMLSRGSRFEVCRP